MKQTHFLNGIRYLIRGDNERVRTARGTRAEAGRHGRRGLKDTTTECDRKAKSMRSIEKGNDKSRKAVSLYSRNLIFGFYHLIAATYCTATSNVQWTLGEDARDSG